ncbi:MAG: glycosyl hydrolase [Pseudomonadota bacterium]
MAFLSLMKRATSLMAIAAVATTAACADNHEESEGLQSELFGGMEWRSIGPALMSGRIADIALVPDDPATWYVGVGSGGVWKTENAGTTWTPLFDDQDVYSIGALALSPHDPNEVWVGTGENHGGRHLSFGNGLHRSRDGGATWEHLGLEESEHLSKIILHPDDSNVVFVASQGPLWSEGGERGLYKTSDGGATWENILSDGPWTGVTDLMMDPRDPDVLYAATWQRHRNVASYLGTGPETSIYKSTDGGETWSDLREDGTGLPDGNMGKIGLAYSPQNPDRLYAAIETDRREGGVWMSDDRGASWSKQSDAVGGGTGPHYYQELYANPHKEGQIFLLSNYTQVSDDHGKNFRTINLDSKHVDDHALVFHPTDPDYVLVGSDGGIYETYDAMKSWRFIDNLPITQFYKVAVDDAEPFYNVYGGTQDNSSQGGPSRTLNVNGIRNQDWFITLTGDGHQSATEPGNPDIMYAQWQQGNLHRVDRTTGESVYIKPQAAPGEPIERWNWDAPIWVSSHDPKRLYFSSQRVWRSDDRGDTWSAVSGDLTRDEDRMQIPVMGRQWSWDAGWDFLAMSVYNTITSFGESPSNPNLLYVGTDDGLIQITENGGKRWREVEVGRLPGVPETAFVNDIRADLHDENTVYIALDNHKYGDYAPYLLKSENRGRTWTSLAEDLPDKHLVWRVVQDHLDPDLLFAATEFGVFMSVNGGENWTEFSQGLPTIALRDITIQRREDDLVAASFGRGFYILDDISPLRDLDQDALEEDALLWPGRRAWWYIQEAPLGDEGRAEQGHGYFTADNPPFGAVFTYYLPKDLQTKEEQRVALEKDATEAGDDTPFPGFDVITEELNEVAPEVMLIVTDGNGEVVRRLAGPTTKGFHRVSWDLTRPDFFALSEMPDDEDSGGFMVMPGTYSVSLLQRIDGETTQLAGPHDFTVEALREGALEGSSPEEVAAFWDRLAAAYRRSSAASAALSELDQQIDLLKVALNRSAGNAEMNSDWDDLRAKADAIKEMLRGNPARNMIGERTSPTVSARLFHAADGVQGSTYGPTPSHLQSLEWAEEALDDAVSEIEAMQTEDIAAFLSALDEAGAPWIPGAKIPAN